MPSQINFDNPLVLNTLNGLSSDRVVDVVEDKNGFAWLGTSNGLCRFDGMEVKTYWHDDQDSSSLGGNFILDVLLDESNGKIWIGTTTGLSVYNPEKNNFKNYYHNPKDANSLSDDWVNKIYKDRNGEIWIGFRDGSLFQYVKNSDNFKKINCHLIGTSPNENKCIHSIYDIHQDLYRDSILWIGTQKGLAEINKHTGATRHFYFKASDEKIQNDINFIRCLTIQPNQRIYYGTWYQGVISFDIETGSYSTIGHCENLDSAPFEKNVTLSFYPKNQNQFWINSTGGLELFDLHSQCIIKSYKNNKTQSYGVNHIDKTGRIWSATRSHGFKIYNPLAQQYKLLTYESPTVDLNGYARKILEDSDRNLLYVASDPSPGLFCYDQTKEEWKVIPPPLDFDIENNNGFKARDIIFLENNEVLVLEDQNLFWYKPGENRLRWYPIQTSNKLHRFLHIIKDKDGLYWISGNRTIWQLDVQAQKLHSLKNSIGHIENGRPEVDHLTEDSNGNIWMRITNGLIIYNKSANDFIYHPHDANGQGAFRGMGNIEVDEKGGIWIATLRNYLAYGHSDNPEAGVQKLYGKDQGLIGNFVYTIKPHQGKILVFTSHGIEVFNPETLRFENNYDKAYGLNQTGSSKLTLLKNGQLAIGNIRKIALFHPDSLRINREEPLPYITSFKVFDENWKLKSNPANSDTILLSYKQNFFSFEFSSVNFNLPEKTTFQYQLEGFDEKWQDGTQRKFAAYTNVPGGDYKFKLRALNNEGKEQNTPYTTHLHISTVWYGTFWFWGLMFMVLSGIGYLIYKWRIKQVRKEERLKSDYERKLAAVEMSALRAQMNPHFIFNSLNSIEYYIINNDPEKASDYLNRFSRLIRLILHNSKNTIVPLKDDLEALKLYIEMESMRFDDLFDYEVKVDNTMDLENTKVPPMLLQPYVENAIWHGLMQKKESRGKLDLTLKKRNGNIVCYIEDNGIGRTASAKLRSKSATRRKSYGMKITSDRLAMLNNLAGSDASVKIIDLENNEGYATGTRVELIIPI